VDATLWYLNRLELRDGGTFQFRLQERDQ
jgi:hypothetical protein